MGKAAESGSRAKSVSPPPGLPVLRTPGAGCVCVLVVLGLVCVKVMLVSAEHCCTPAGVLSAPSSQILKVPISLPLKLPTGGL